MSARIVVADDSSTILAMLDLALRREGYEPAIAEDGVRALELIREHRPELVILDAVMPGADGYDVCKALREDASAARPYVIMLTAGGRDSDRARADDAGVDEFMTKPFSPSALRARVKEILGAP